jgi:hypothetical protein
MSYSHQVNYSKRIINGILAGKLYHTHLRFCSLADARRFVANAKTGRVFKACAGVGDYRIEDAQIIDLADFA